MKISETVTFGGSGLDRMAHLRGDADRIAEMLQAPGTEIIPLWRGMLLFDNQSFDRVLSLPAAHPVFDGAGATLFLGMDNGTPVFARDISERDLTGAGEDAPEAFINSGEYSDPALAPGQVFCDIRNVMARLPARDAELAATARSLFEWHANHGYCANCGHRTVQGQAGWQRDCPACEKPHFPRTDPVVIMLVTRGNRVLMGRSPHWPEGIYSLLAGFLEPGETIEAAVRREVFEEAGITTGAVTYLASQPWPFPSSLMIGCHTEATSETITIDPVEIENALWVTREEMVDVAAGTHPVIKPSRNGAIAGFLVKHWLADRLK
jgi:NAD+ diphosphatase